MRFNNLLPTIAILFLPSIMFAANKLVIVEIRASQVMDYVGPAYWIFKDGRVFIVTPESTNIIATYSKLGSDWRYCAQTNTSTVLKATILGMTIINMNEEHTNIFYISRRCLSWL
jgi:hypothetical protein